MKNLLIYLTILIVAAGCSDTSTESINKEIEDFYEEPEYEIFASFNHSQNVTVHSSLTKEVIDTMQNQDLEVEIFIDISTSLSKDENNEYSHLKELTKGQLAVYTTWIVEGEVNNGGFNQLYYNSSGMYSELAIQGFETLGLIDYAKLASRANEINNEIRDKLNSADDGSLEAFSESYEDNPLNKLDDEFYALSNKIDISDIRIKYIRENINEFVK